MATMRAKVVVNSVEAFQCVELLKMSPVSSNNPFGPNGESEDNTYARYTPGGNVTLNITNPDLFGKFKPGKKFYVDFTEAPE
jgi:hypothetical protein